MDLLTTAVVDITTLVATCHALVDSPDPSASAMAPKLRRRLRREIKRGTVAYIDVLARTKRGGVDEALLGDCRVAAERQMGQAVEHQGMLRELMLNEPGSLAGLAAARHDLWRVARIAVHLRVGVATLLESGVSRDPKPARSLARHLRRRLRKALIAYASATLRGQGAQGPRLASARAGALAEIGRSGALAAKRLADLEAGIEAGAETGADAGSEAVCTVLRQGVTKPLADLVLDWQRQEDALR